jgi:hypothetical protein
MKKTQIIIHQGKNVFYMDFSKLNTVEEIRTVMNDAKEFIYKQPLSTVFALSNIDGMHFNNQIKDLFAEFVKENKPYIKASALIGMNGLKQIVFNGLMRITGRDIKSFSTIDEAKNWLISQN